MKERPILFSGDMVKAILAGTKTQTRRVVTTRGQLGFGYPVSLRDAQENHVHRCPYGQTGDQLWVKEAIYYAGSMPQQIGPDYDQACFAADDALTKLDTWPWKRDRLPGMFMPRGLSRITLEVLSVRVERLNDISPYDACCEGIAADGPNILDPVLDFRTLWESINAKHAPWASNPWVWVVEFKRIEVA